MKAASTESFGYNTDEIVSSDIVGSTYGSIFDATQTMVAPMEDGNTQVQVVSWYDKREQLHLSDGSYHQVLQRVSISRQALTRKDLSGSGLTRTGPFLDTKIIGG